MFCPDKRESEILMWATKALEGEAESFQRRFATMLSQLNTDEWKLLEKMAITLAGASKELEKPKENPAPVAPEQEKKSPALEKPKAEVQMRRTPTAAHGGGLVGDAVAPEEDVKKSVGLYADIDANDSDTLAK